MAAALTLFGGEGATPKALRRHADRRWYVAASGHMVTENGTGLPLTTDGAQLAAGAPRQRSLRDHRYDADLDRERRDAAEDARDIDAVLGHLQAARSAAGHVLSGSTARPSASTA
ncbi:MAG: hypothetical protein ABIQ33_04940 [Caldimonas sp.]